MLSRIGGNALRRNCSSIKNFRECSTLSHAPIQMSKYHDEPVRLAHTAFQTVNQVTTGPPVIILHGLFGSKRNWNTLAKAISKTGKKVVTVDCRNHGDSPHAPVMTYNAMAADVEFLMEEMEVEQATILGHSMGGKIAMDLALTRPDLVSRLVVEDISPSVFQTQVSVSFMGYIDAMLDVQFDHSLTMPLLRSSVSQQLMPTFPEKSLRDFILTNIVYRDELYQWKVNLPVIKQYLKDIVSFPHFTQPYEGETLFIGGSLSQHISEKDHPEIKRLFPKADIRYIKGAGHWVHAEKPADFLKMFLNFCDTH